MNNRNPILLVEDDRIDAMTVKRALKELNVTNRVEHAKNGEEAIAYLEQCDHDKPCIILLDLNMPKMNGLEFLNVVKQDEKYSMIPVIVLTTSSDDHDRIESFRQNVAGYMIKPVDYMQFVDTMRTIQLYWTLSELPA